MSSTNLLNMRTCVRDMKLRLLEYWKCLQKEFNVNVEFKVLTDKQYWNDILSKTNEKESYEEKIKFLQKPIKNNLLYNSNSIAYTNWSIHRNDGFIKVENVCVKTHLSQLQQMMFKGLADLERVYDYIKLVLRHEMGHVLDALSFNVMTVLDYDNMTTIRRTERNELLNTTKNHVLSKESSLDNNIYHFLPDERMANGYVGNTTEMIISNDYINNTHSLIEIFYL